MYMQKITRKRNYISFILLMCLCFCGIQDTAVNTICAAEYTEPAAAVSEIDLGDYQSQMTVGEKQLLSVTILPAEAAGQDVAYSSSDTNVAIINGMGRITALKAGVTEITVSCGGITEKFGLTVTDAQSTVRDLDLGDCPSELEVGSSQLLSITIIPEEASGQKITYQSSDTKVVTVNEIGRVMGVKEGTATITVCCGNVKKDFKLKVVKAKSGDIPVTDIEIADYEDELEVDKTMTLSVTVLPSDATDNTVKYTSSNEKVATVNSSGEVKGISEGNVVITVSAGEIKKKVSIRVKTATSMIKLNTTYLVLQRGESYVLKASVYPAEADQKVLFESVNQDIVSVSGSGVVTAKQCGTGTVIVKNSDTSTALTVIVNEKASGEQVSEKESMQEETMTEYDSIVSSADYPVISSDMLRYFYRTGQVLTVYGTDYTLRIDGKQICNYENEFYTDLQVTNGAEGIHFELNRSNRLCGQVVLLFDDDTLKDKYVYLYNEGKEKYELLKTVSENSLELDTEGKYLLTEQKLSSGKIRIVVFIVAGVLLVVMAGVYIGVKKRYWFW